MPGLNILEFISAEHNNELVSIANLKSELNFLQELDDIYQEIRTTFSVNANNNVHFMVSNMYLKAHNEFYIGMSQYLRLHFSKTLVSLRIAIEAAFNTYYFTKNPQHIEDYLKENSKVYKRVFKHIKEYIKENISDYPLARDLIKTYETASIHSAHPTIKSFAYKYEHIKKTAETPEQVLLNYFDKLDSSAFFFYYFALLIFYFKVFKLFYECFYKKELKVEYPEREKNIVAFERRLMERGKQYKLPNTENKHARNSTNL